MEIGVKEWEESRWEMSRHTGFVLCVVEMRSRQGNAQESRWEKQRKSGKKLFRQKVQSGQTGENDIDVIRTYEGQRIRRRVNRNKLRLVFIMQMTAIIT